MPQILIVFLLVIMGLPLGGVTYLAASHFRISEWVHYLSTVFLWDFITSMELVFLTGLLTGVVGTACAWMVARYRFPGSRLFDFLLILPLAVPTYIAAMVYYETVFPFWRHNLFWAIVVQTLCLYPYVFMIARVAFRTQSQAYIEAAQMCGANDWNVFWRVALPLSLTSIIAGMLFVGMEVLGDFGTMQMFGISTLTVGIYRTWLELNQGWMAAQQCLMLIGLVLLGTMAAHRFQNRNVSNDAGSDRPLRQEPLLGWRGWLATTFCATPIVMGVIYPISVLAWWSYLSWSMVEWELFWSDFGQTAILVSLTALLCLLTGMIAAYGVRWMKEERSKTLLLHFMQLSYALPGIAMGVAFLVVFKGSWAVWLASGWGIILFAFVVRYSGLSYSSIHGNLQRIDTELDDAARVLGAGRFRIIRDIHIPMAWTGLLCSMMLVVIDSIKELTMTLLLQPFNFGNLALRVYSLARTEMVYESGVWALCLIFITAILLFGIYALDKPSRE